MTTLGDLFAYARDDSHRLPARWTAARAALDATAPLNIATNHDGMFHAAPLLDHVRFARGFEAALRLAWRDWVARA